MNDNLPVLNEEEIQALGRSAVTRGYVRVVGKSSNKAVPSAYLVALVNDPTRGSRLDNQNGQLSPFQDLQIFYKFGLWYDADSL